MKIRKFGKIILSSLFFTSIFLQANTSMASDDNFDVYYYSSIDIDSSYIGKSFTSSSKSYLAEDYESYNNEEVVIEKEDPMAPACRLYLSAEELELIINTAYPNNKLIKNNDPKLTEGFTQTLVDLENELGINPFFILGIINAENPILRGELSNLVKKKNNLMSWAAYDHDPFNKASTFESYSHAISHPARFLAENYLNPDGKYYVDGTVEGVNKHYASAKNWYKNVNYGMKKLNDTRIMLGL